MTREQAEAYFSKKPWWGRIPDQQRHLLLDYIESIDPNGSQRGLNLIHCQSPAKLPSDRE